MKRLLIIAVLLVSGVNVEANSSVAAFRINNLDGALQELGGLMQMIGIPVPLDEATAPLGQFTMSPELEGIDTSKPITVYMGADIASPNGMPSVAVRFAVTGDGSEYLASVGAQLPDHEKKSETIHKFNMSPPGVDNGMAFYAVVKNGRALVGYNVSEMQSLVKSVGAEGNKLLKQFPGNLTVWMNVEELDKKVSKQIEQYNEMMEQMKAMGVDQSTPPGQMDPSAMMDGYSEMIHGLLMQLDQLIVNVDFNNQLTLRSYFAPKADSAIASIIDQMTVPGSTFSSMDIPGSLFGGFGTMDGMDEMLEPYADWFASVYSSMGPPMDAFAESYKEMVLAMKGIYSGGYNFFLLPPKAEDILQMVGVYEIDDKEKVKANMDLMMKMQVEQMAALSGGDDNVEASDPEESEYRGMTVTSYSMGMDFDEELMGEMPPGYSDMMSNMKYHTAITDDYLYYALGAIANLDPVIDHLNNGGSGSIVKGFDDVGAEPISYWYLDIPGIVSGFSGVMGIPGAEKLQFDGVSGVIRGIGFKELSGASSIMRLTAQDIQGLVQMGMQISMMTSQAMGSPAAGAPEQQPQLPDELMMPEE